MAFDAQFLFCSFLIDAAAALDGVAWMQQVAQQDGKRLVVNMSWGLYYMGTLDGHSLISQALDQFSAEGVVFSISAGNNGACVVRYLMQSDDVTADVKRLRDALREE